MEYLPLAPGARPGTLKHMPMPPPPELILESMPRSSRVVCNCRNYSEAMVAFEEFVNDPRKALKGVLLKFEVVNHKGELWHHAYFDPDDFLRGEGLAVREIAWNFGHTKLVGLVKPSVPKVFVLLPLSWAGLFITRSGWLAI
jgi:hypothetical protein